MPVRNLNRIGIVAEFSEDELNGIVDIHDQRMMRIMGKYPYTPSATLTLKNSSGTVVNQIDEGQNLTCEVTAQGLAGQTLYYTIYEQFGYSFTAADFNIGGLSGSFAISNSQSAGTGSFTLNFTADGIYENDPPARIHQNAVIEIRMGSTSGTVLTSGICEVIDQAVPTAISELYTLYNSSTPSGLTFTSGSGLNTGWSTSYGFQTGGNASGFSTPLSRTASLSYTSDWLLQVTTRCYNSCWDPAIQIWPSNNGRTAPQWGWSNSNSSCVSYQCNCKSYTMICSPSGGSNSGSIGGSNNGEYFTQHLWWVPSQSKIYAKITYGSNDASVSGSLAATATYHNFSNYNSSDCYVGLASDYDGKSISYDSTNFTFFRIREFGGGYSSNTTNLPTW